MTSHVLTLGIGIVIEERPSRPPTQRTTIQSNARIPEDVLQRFVSDLEAVVSRHFMERTTIDLRGDA